MANKRYLVLMALMVLVGLIATLPMANASYAIKTLNVTITLNQSSTAQVTEVLSLVLTNTSIQQYSTNRVALNLTLSQWQLIVGPQLVEHVVSPESSIYNFKFLPGPVVTDQYGTSRANITLVYYVTNVTSFNRTAPRTFVYKFNPKVLNFEHGVSGVVLGNDTTLTIKLPNTAAITSIYPVPDLPPNAFTKGYKNVTQISWLYGEPLSKFTLIFVIKQSIQGEVVGFFNAIYEYLGIFTYIIIAAAVVLFMLYVYIRAIR